jgi:hypothetical protein
VFVLWVAAHLVADYLLQSRRMIDAKRSGSVGVHSLHALSFGVLAALFSLPWLSWALALVIAALTVSHAVIDFAKVRVRRSMPSWAFTAEVMDLFLHLALLFLGVHVACGALHITGYTLPGWYAEPGFYRGVLYLSAIVLVTRGGTFLVRSLLEQVGRVPENSGETGNSNEYNLGRTIGNLERLLILAFALIGSYGAVGFVLAAKSIARFRELNERSFAEYYLVGTLASSLVALATAWGVILLRELL